MSRTAAILLGLGTGAAVAAALLLLASAWLSSAPAATAGLPPRATPPPPPPSAAPRVRTQPVMIYQRAATAELTLEGVEGQIVWFPGAVERAEEIVRLVLEGVEQQGVLPPAGRPLAYRRVFIDSQGVAWVDLDADAVDRLEGSDTEQAVVAALARSLVEGLDEVRAVGVLVGGETRRTLAGHVDLTRVYDGSEWPRAFGDGLSSEMPEAAPAGASPS